MRLIIPAIVAGSLVVTGAAGYGVNEAISSDVVVSVDGQRTEVRTWSDTVGAVLAKQGITLGEHDTVAPSVTSNVTDGTEISVRYGRPVTVVIDGTEQTRWVTATTVDEALGLFGIRGDVRLSTNRSSAISRDGIRFEVTTPHGATITADGKTTPVTTFGTVADALAVAGIVLGPLDQVTPAPTTAITEGTAITVIRVELREVTKQVEVPFEKQRKDDPSLPKGTTKVTQPGINGAATEIWTQEVRDGQVVNEVRKTSNVTKPSQAEVTLVGTKDSGSTKTPTAPQPGETSTPSPGTSMPPATGNSCGASFYDEGQKTANGETFNPNAMTAAHKSLPFNSRVKVTNPKTGKSVIVRINDRGPYVSGRCLDLSRAAFEAIAPLSAGAVTVNWQVVG